MKKIFLQISSPIFENNTVFIKHDINNANFRWRRLKEKMEALGFELITADNNDLKDCEGIIFHDATSLYGVFETKTKIKNYIKRVLNIKSAPVYPTRDLYTEAVKAGLKDKMVLLITEGKAVYPVNFLPEVLNKFSRVLTWDDDLLQNPKFVRCHFCMQLHPPIQKVPWNEKKLLTNISIHKYSPYKNQLYSARRKTIAYFDKHYPNDFDLYGNRWNVPITRLEEMFPFLVKKYATYRGHCKDKLETLSRYKFNICYENNWDAKGYVTEKIFDSIHAHIVPIYWGASNIEKYVDTNVFIDRRKFASDKDLAEFITHITEKEYEKYLEAAKQYVKSEKYKEFLPETFCDRVIYALGL